MHRERERAGARGGWKHIRLIPRNLRRASSSHNALFSEIRDEMAILLCNETHLLNKPGSLSCSRPASVPRELGFAPTLIKFSLGLELPSDKDLDSARSMFRDIG